MVYLLYPPVGPNEWMPTAISWARTLSCWAVSNLAPDSNAFPGTARQDTIFGAVVLSLLLLLLLFSCRYCDIFLLSARSIALSLSLLVAVDRCCVHLTTHLPQPLLSSPLMLMLMMMPSLPPPHDCLP